MDSKRRYGVLLGYLNILVKNAVNLIYTPLLLSFVGKGDYGVFQTANSFIFSLSLLSLGFSSAYIKYYTVERVKDNEKGVCNLNTVYLLLFIGISLLALTIGLVLSQNIQTLFQSTFSNSEMGLASNIMLILSFNIALTLLSNVFDANIVVNEEFTYQQSRQLFTTLATPFIAYLLLSMGCGVVGVAIAQLIITSTLLLINIRYAIIKLNMRFNIKTIDISVLKPIAIFSAWIFMNQLCDIINQNVPIIILGAKCGAGIVAVFAVSIQIRNLFMSLSMSLSNVFVPQVNRIVARNDDSNELTNLMIKVGMYQLLLIMWVYGGFIFLGRYFIRVWAGDSFVDAYRLVLIMVSPLIVPLAQNIGIEIQRAKNLHRTRSMVYLVMAIISSVLTYCFAERLGYWISATSYALAIVIGSCIFMNWYYQKYVDIDIKLYWKNMVPILLVAIVDTVAFYTITTFFPVTNIVGFMIYGIAYTTIYLFLLEAAARLWRPQLPQPTIMLKRLLKKRSCD